jgi:putative glycosyltransferase (TIGR04372 family)
MVSKGEFRQISNRFQRALKNRDYSAITWTFLSAAFRLLGLICAIPTVLILWILKPFFWLKVGRLSSARVGELAANTDLFIRRRQLGIIPDGPFYCFIADPTQLANRQLLTMFKRVIPICESRILSVMFVGILPILKRTPFHQDLSFNGNEYYEFNNAKPSLQFTPDEITKGRKLLKQMNVDFDNDEYICIFARDSAYLKKVIPENNWSGFNARDSEIDSLIETAKFLIEKGFTVIRVGSIVKKPINFSHEKMIDLPYSGHQSDFLDIFIAAYCKFLISAGTSGANELATIFDRPMLAVNIAEFGYSLFQKNCLYTPKKYKFINTNEYLNLKDGLKLGGFWSNLADFGLETEEISPQDILEATQEMLARSMEKFTYSPEEERLAQAYHKLWSETDNHWRPNKTPIGIAWLKKNQSLYF